MLYEVEADMLDGVSGSRRNDEIAGTIKSMRKMVDAFVRGSDAIHQGDYIK